MAKRVNSASLKGKLEIDFDLGVATVTEVTKDSEYEYDFFKLLEEFNGKSVTISIKEEQELPTTEQDYNVSSESDGEEQEDYYVED